jgi:hypothetical protein
VVHLTSHHRKFFVAELNGTVAANRDASRGPGPWETWRVEKADDGRIALRSHHGKLLTAEGGGGGVVVADRDHDTPGPWEMWAVEKVDGGVALRSWDGHYLCAEVDGTVNATRTEIGPWETWLPDPSNAFGAQPADSALKGVLRYEPHGVFRDDSGPVLPVFCHYMSAFSDWIHGREAEVKRNLEKVAAAGYQGIRVLDVLGYWDADRQGNPAGWFNRAVTPFEFTSHGNRRIPATDAFYERKREFLLTLHGFGLKAMDDRGDLNSWSRSQKLQHMSRNGQLYAGMGDAGKEVLAGIWACNESWQNGVPDRDEACAMIDAFKEGSGGWWPDVRGLSWGSKENNWDTDPTGELPDSMIWWSKDPATVITEHGSRTAHREHLIAHYLGYGFYDTDLRARGKRCWNTEPVGGGEGVTVGRVDDAERLCGIATEALLSGQAWTHMSGAGVWAERDLDADPGFHEIPRLLKYLPRDLHAFDTIGHAGTRFQGTRILAAIDNPPTRADYAIDSDTGRFVMNVYGEHAPLPFERAVAECKVIDLATDTIQSEGPRNAGDRFTESYRHHRLVVGRLA